MGSRKTVSALQFLAEEQGYVIYKSRNCGWPQQDDHGEYMVVDASNNVPVFGWNYDATLEDVAQYLDG